MRHPWHALTRLLTDGIGESTDSGGSLGEASLQEAWTEAAARMGLVRLVWWAERGDTEPSLAYPCLRSAVRSYPGPRRYRALSRSICGGEEEQSVEVDGAVLAAAALPGRLPPRAVLSELATLALALLRKHELIAERRRTQQRLAQADATAAAGHDLRNELTRALLFAGRGHAGDGAEVVRALGAARDLAQSALLPPLQHSYERAAELTTLGLVDLRILVTEEIRAAAAAARAPLGRVPSVRLKCPKRVNVLVHERTFRRAIRNATLNAMEAAVGRGSVSLLAKRLDSVTTSGHGVTLEIEDQGVGMSEQEVRRFLDPRGATVGDSAVADDLGGKPASTGLGTASLALALTASSIPLRVRSAPGVGTRLTFWLREIVDLRSPVQVVVDPDVRRARRRIEVLRKRFGAAWAVESAAAAAPLLRSEWTVQAPE
ncbi:Histidine kinase-, DNA gyrase B-, and HSP90-like ATPase [Planctomycetes bacterium Poly30]|uniref:Histidine kinase-, DNA gyrase B-, and HSP90-like ATPase n=1 Tax=Saltatorellus ferox TaxID=2528018 RepID=A0A518ETG4_9BACT|nr:Histidine kinase-, DNA gyrase B-, and HSP90-like ATPase [Planctomycetes bacterium Poly30]